MADVNQWALDNYCYSDPAIDGNNLKCFCPDQSICERIDNQDNENCPCDPNGVPPLDSGVDGWIIFGIFIGVLITLILVGLFIRTIYKTYQNYQLRKKLRNQPRIIYKEVSSAASSKSIGPSDLIEDFLMGVMKASVKASQDLSSGSSSTSTTSTATSVNSVNSVNSAFGKALNWMFIPH